MAKKDLYTEKSIESLSPLEFTRLRPGVYCGDTSYATQLLVEIVSNAVDEFRLGHGNQIDVIIDKDVVSVQDYGQGFLPNVVREDGKTILEAAFSVLNTSGKYREDGAYEGTSLGSFGIGSKITTYLSHWLEVNTWRDGQGEYIKFVEGEFNNRVKGEVNKGISGTLVKWQPSEEFFTHTEIDAKVIKDLFKTVVCLCPGLTINLNLNGDNIKYYSEKGLNDLVDAAVKDNELISNRFILNYAEDKYKLDLVMTYTSNYSLTLVPYVNTGLTESGNHITQIKSLITKEFNKFIREKGWLKEKDENLTGDDIQEGMYLVFNITSPGVAYDAQVKSRITRLDMKPFLDTITEHYQYWMAANEKDVKSICEKALNARKAREAAKKARENVRSQEKKKEKALKFDSKIADCYSKSRAKCEIYVTEGDSASGTLKTARNNEFQAVMPLRGKILNCQKATLEQIQKNAEIVTMIEAFGLQMNPKTMKLMLDPEELRYGKIIIAADGDVDGSHIRNLFYTFIWNFCPELITGGYVYSLVAPLYKVTVGKDTYIYLKDDAALEEWRTANPNKKYVLSRFKGLGEMSAEETEVLVDPALRTLCQVTVEDVTAANRLFEDLMGLSVTPRKKFIQEHSAEAKYE
jgi:DNA gyrase/topoisomerase IV subunit B